MNIKECMSLNPVYATTEDTVSKVAQMMNDYHIGVVPVCDNTKNVVGVITDRDIILRSIASDKDVKQTPVTEIMSTKVIMANTDMQVSDVAKQMQDNQIRRIPVMENNQLVGIVSIGDLAKADKVGRKEVADTMECICGCEGNNDKNNM